MTIINLIQSATSATWRRLIAIALEINRALSVTDLREGDPLRRERDELVCQPRDV